MIINNFTSHRDLELLKMWGVSSVWKIKMKVGVSQDRKNTSCDILRPNMIRISFYLRLKEAKIWVKWRDRRRQPCPVSALVVEEDRKSWRHENKSIKIQKQTIEGAPNQRLSILWWIARCVSFWGLRSHNVTKRRSNASQGVTLRVCFEGAQLLSRQTLDQLL